MEKPFDKFDRYEFQGSFPASIQDQLLAAVPAVAGEHCARSGCRRRPPLWIRPCIRGRQTSLQSNEPLLEIRLTFLITCNDFLMSMF